MSISHGGQIISGLTIIGEPWVKVCVVMLPYNLLANGLAIIHPQTGNQENAFSYSAYGHIRTHSQGQLESIDSTDDDMDLFFSNAR